jgi:hypothetical protein
MELLREGSRKQESNYARRLFILIAATMLLANSSPVSASQTSDETFHELEARISKAVKTRNTEQLSSLLADGFISVGFTGHVRSKAEVIETYTNGKTLIKSANETEVIVRQFDDTAVVVGTLTLIGNDSGTDITGSYRFMRVYKKFGEKWQAISFEATPDKAAA